QYWSLETEKALAEQERQYNMNYDLKLKEYEEGVRQFNDEMERLKQLDAEEKRQFDLAYAEKNKSNEIKIKDETTSGTNTSGYTGKFLPTPGKTTESKEIRDFIEKNLASAGKSSNSSAQQKLTNDEKKQGETKTNSEGSRRIGSTQAPIADAGLKAGANLAMELAGNYFAKGAYAVATNYYRGDLNPDAKTYGTFSNGYQPKGISGHGELEKTGENVSVPAVVQYGTKKGKTVEVKQNVWKAEDGTRWIWDGMNNCYVPE
ncbi:MAG: hypothetical protein PUC73_11285, partial [Lachnospiraceae bacterium]|nr:hypothetical protein [Lachnospiraceae bacterium]